MADCLAPASKQAKQASSSQSTSSGHATTSRRGRRLRSLADLPGRIERGREGALWQDRARSSGARDAACSGECDGVLELACQKSGACTRRIRMRRPSGS
jgi:hypothetical protein